MSDSERPDLKALGERLERARRSRPPEEPPASTGQGDSFLRVALGLGFRIGVEMVAALGIGTGIGWLVDQGLGTKPWGMVLFMVLGAGAGMANVWRAMTGQGMAIGFRRKRGG
jgi:ATP synthase protein I